MISRQIQSTEPNLMTCQEECEMLVTTGVEEERWMKMSDRG